MNLHTLKPAEGSVSKKKRIGRGQGSGRGGTSTKGHKGAKSRSGYKTKRAFEGGQMPYQMRIPKRGFKNINRVRYVPLNLKDLQGLADKHGTDLNVEQLIELGVINKNDKVKILGTGELTSSVKITAHAASVSAKAAIESKGGALTIV